MDPVIFTGRVTKTELAEERADEYARLQTEGTLDRIRVDPPPPWLVKLGYTVGAAAISVGLTLVALILYAVLT
jgi:hypothetical protein